MSTFSGRHFWMGIRNEMWPILFLTTTIGLLLSVSSYLPTSNGFSAVLSPSLVAGLAQVQRRKASRSSQGVKTTSTTACKVGCFTTSEGPAGAYELGEKRQEGCYCNDDKTSDTNVKIGIVIVPKRRNKTNVVASAILASILLTTTLTQPAMASDYKSFTPEQLFIAEVWRTVDNVYIDRTFNHQDWFKVRQTALAQKYDTMEEARSVAESMLSSLGDKYTRYLPPAKYDSMVNAATGNLVGVGVELASTAPTTSSSTNTATTTAQLLRIVVADVEPNGPADKGGLRPGDVFLEVDGTKFDYSNIITPDDVANVVRGPLGSKVGVVVERDGKVFDFILKREPIKITSVRSYVANNNNNMGGGGNKVGVIRIKNFSGTTSETVKNEILTLKEKQGVTTFILDVRGNPGGLLPGGVDTASLFLKANKPVVYVVNKNGIVDAQSTLVDGVDSTSPLIVLVDKNTASAAEVMTAALKENHRATIAGQQTFGKGIVQTIRQLDEGENGGVAVTIARYETPDHHDINKQGIPVDVETDVDCAKDDALSCLTKEAFSFKT